MNEERLQQFKNIGREFSDAVCHFSEIVEIGIIGSTAGNSNYPGDLDIYIILDNFNHISDIARLGRKIWGQKYISPDIFFLDREFNDLGRLCHRKECPKGSIYCYEKHPGVPFVHDKEGFVFDKREFLSSPLIELYSPEKIFLKEQEKYGIKEVRQYENLEDRELHCIECGDYFVFSIAEQKFYEYESFVQPKRCEGCREERQLELIENG